jgi:hypothetical protein
MGRVLISLALIVLMVGIAVAGCTKLASAPFLYEMFVEKNRKFAVSFLADY